MKKTIALLAATSAVAVAAPAMAQDNATFTGPRVEVLAGYDQSRAGSDQDNDFNEDDDQSIDGIAYGVGVGYDFAMNNVVLGLEGELTDSSAKYDFDEGDGENLGFSSRLDTGRDLYVGARVGFLASPNALIYAKGGYTNARYNVLARDGETELETNIDTDGFRIGAGAEYAMTPNTFFKLEYRYSNYSSAEFDFGDFEIPDTMDFDVDLDRHQVMAGVGYRF